MANSDANYKNLVRTIATMIRFAQGGHYASSLSALQILYPLMYEQNVEWWQIILSKGHGVPALYAILYDRKILTKEEIASFRTMDGLPGHPSITTPGIIASSGSLGMGISKAAGMALADPYHHYHVIVGDGELQEGQCWEALFWIAAEKLQNITVHIDANGHQYAGWIGDRWNNVNHAKAFSFVRVHYTAWIESNSYLLPSVLSPYQERMKEHGRKLFTTMLADPSVYCLSADLDEDFGLEHLRIDCSERFIRCGISEQHMASLASGLAKEGKIPVCHTFGSFWRRAIDQIYNNCLDKLPILYVAGLCGRHTTNIGLSHRSTDYLIQNWLPVVNNDFEAALNLIYNGESVYLRYTLNGEDDVDPMVQ